VDVSVVSILVHPSPLLSKSVNFELKKAIAKTWAKDAENYGASVYFVGEHYGETFMRKPREFAKEPMKKMLIPSILENGQDDNASGYLKARIIRIRRKKKKGDQKRENKTKQNKKHSN
jgi:hypothetical protein